MANSAPPLPPELVAAINPERNAEVCQHGLALAVIAAGGRLRFSAEDLAKMPAGGLSYRFDDDGGVTFAFVTEENMGRG